MTVGGPQGSDLSAQLERGASQPHSLTLQRTTSSTSETAKPKVSCNIRRTLQTSVVCSQQNFEQGPD